MPEVVRATSLTRTFGPRVAVRDLSLVLEQGEIVALLGPNGAGKTTTLRMLAGLIPPSTGSIELQGVPLTRESSDQLRRHIGLLTETPGLWERLPVRLNLLTYARLYGLTRPHDAVNRALSLVSLTDRIRDVAGTLSKGLRQRLALARALLHEPPIVLLDEPTSGLDPASARHVRDVIADLRRQGRALLVSTHNLAEAEELADRIAILNTTLLAFDTPSALRQRLHGVRVEVAVEGPAETWLPQLIDMVGDAATASGSVLTAILETADRTPDLVETLVRAGARIRRVTPSERSLEEVYLSLVGRVAGAAA
jgi:ABC-2 type transport system ATP-binding protein